MKRIMIAGMIAAPLTAVAGYATAGGLAEPVIAPAPVPVVAPAPVATGRDWTGFYAGGSLGFGTLDVPGVDGDFEGLTFGGHAGYNYDLGSIVLGAELEGALTNDFTNDGADLELDQVLRAKVRAGYDAGAYLPYVAAGWAQATVGTGGDDLEDTGYFYGVGLDYALSDAITVGGEVLRHEFEDFDGAGDVTADTFGLRVSYNF